MAKATIKQISEKAGVSMPTVSRILNHKDFVVSRENREKVLSIARELNYRPNYFAKSLKDGKTNCLGLMGSLSIVDLSTYCFTTVSASIEQALADSLSKYSLIIFGANFQGSQRKSQELIARGIVDGLILIILSTDLRSFEQDLAPNLWSCNIPFVVVHSTAQTLAYNNVGLDNRRAGYQAAEHFFKLGYRDIRFYQRTTGNPQVMEMQEGFITGCRDLGVPAGDACVMRPPHGESGNIYQDAYQTIMGLKDFPEAILLSDDPAAYGMLAACEERGVRVPGDLALIGFDDEQIPYLKTRLSTFYHPFKEKGREAVAMLTDILENGQAKGEVRQKVLNADLIVRETCGQRLKQGG